MIIERATAPDCRGAQRGEIICASSGLSDALALAEALERRLQTGEVALALCDATIGNNAELPVVAAIEAWARSQGLELLHHEAAIDENFVAEFAEFVRASGGFSIW
jgi:hypothetical protein